MKTFQKKGMNQKSSISPTTFPSLAQPSRPFVAVPAPASEQEPRVPEAQLDHTGPVGYSIATLPLFPPMTPSSERSAPVQRSLAPDKGNTHAIPLSGAFPLQQKRSAKDSSVEGISQEGEPLPGNPELIQNKESSTGLPDTLKAGIETLSGISMDDVQVHYNSTKPAHVQALAYTQGTDIYVEPGQERHLLHEAWHVVQQMQGRVKPTLQAKGVAINDDERLEREADVMGERTNKVGHLLLQRKKLTGSQLVEARTFTSKLIQRMRNISFDASPYADGLNNAYDATQTHFTYLEDNEITGGGPWLAQPGENLHVTIQNTDHTIVAHYFYDRATRNWRYHAYGGGPIPYGTHNHANLQSLQTRAIEFAWPSPVVFKTKSSQKGKKKTKNEVKKAKEEANLKLMDEFFPQKKKTLIQLPPGNHITEQYVVTLINAKDEASLEYIFRSPDWPLTKWDMEAWARFLDWLTE